MVCSYISCNPVPVSWYSIHLPNKQTDNYINSPRYLPMVHLHGHRTRLRRCLFFPPQEGDQQRMSEIWNLDKSWDKEIGCKMLKLLSSFCWNNLKSSWKKLRISRKVMKSAGIKVRSVLTDCVAAPTSSFSFLHISQSMFLDESKWGSLWPSPTWTVF